MPDGQTSIPTRPAIRNTSLGPADLGATVQIPRSECHNPPLRVSVQSRTGFGHRQSTRSRSCLRTVLIRPCMHPKHSAPSQGRMPLAEILIRGLTMRRTYSAPLLARTHADTRVGHETTEADFRCSHRAKWCPRQRLPRREATELFHPVMLGLTQPEGSHRLEAWIGCGSQANKRTQPGCERSGGDPP